MKAVRAKATCSHGLQVFLLLVQLATTQCGPCELRSRGRCIRAGCWPGGRQSARAAHFQLPHVLPHPHSFHPQDLLATFVVMTAVYGVLVAVLSRKAWVDKNLLGTQADDLFNLVYLPLLCGLSALSSLRLGLVRTALCYLHFTASHCAHIPQGVVALLDFLQEAYVVVCLCAGEAGDVPGGGRTPR